MNEKECVDVTDDEKMQTTSFVRNVTYAQATWTVLSIGTVQLV